MEGFKGRFVKGSEPESVYWKRRGIVAGAALVLIVLAVLGLNALGGEGDDESGVEADAAKQEWVPPSSTASAQRPYIPEPSASPSEAPSSTAPPVAACTADQLMLQVVAAFDEVRSGSEVPVSVLVASGADTPCTVDLRSVAVELAAGSDVVYSTAHCETPQGEEVELSGGAGQTVEFTVDGLASDEGCQGARRELPAGDYELRARLGEAVSSPAALRLT
ncbi:hypothetical protein [Glycomyces albidus]|uniref:MucR family transcriptional regulator n=1 Tax=Glycomyces albidus TaxID=2656774 RepID=A0A6L5G805_9ACTN|nr:hypothetical protein [Glycomyces albidus]MQM25767.1 hypothetical protein [Glycomyces albidus]